MRLSEHDSPLELDVSDDAGEWAAWATPREMISRLPWVTREWARSRARAWRIRHGR